MHLIVSCAKKKKFSDQIKQTAKAYCATLTFSPKYNIYTLISCTIHLCSYEKEVMITLNNHHQENSHEIQPMTKTFDYAQPPKERIK